MAPETFLPVMYLATGALMLMWGLILLRRFSHEELHRVVAFMLFFAGTVPILAGVGLVQPESADGQLFMPGSFLDRFSYIWEFYFPTLLLFSLVFPERRAILQRLRALPVFFYLPYVVHILIILSARSVEPSSILDSWDAPPDFLREPLVSADNLWSWTVKLHAWFFPAFNLLVGLTALLLLLGNPELRQEVTLRRQRLFLTLGFALPLTGYFFAEALPNLLGRAPLAIVKVHVLSISMILSSAAIGYAAIRHRFLRIRLLARRGILEFSVSLILAIVYLLVLNGFQSFFGAYLGALAPLFEAGFTVFAIILFQPILTRIEGVLDRWFFGHSGDLRRQMLGRFGARLGDVRDLAGIEGALKPVLRDAFHVDAFQLLAWDLPEAQQDRPSPEWFTPIRGEACDALRELSGPLRWWEFLAICRRMDLPEPPAEAPYEYVIPLADEAACRGLLLIAAPTDRSRLRGGDREHLILLAGQLAAALRNVSLLQELLGKRILEEEMQLAQNIQLGLLPKEKPKLQGIDLHGLSRPSRQVGGDYYDWLERGEDLYLIIADVAGKGIPAAMLMATVQASLRALAREGMAPGEILSELNDIVYDNSPRDRFVTLWLGRMQMASRALDYASAGHPPPYLTRDGGATVPLQEGGLILGAFPSTEFETHSIPFGVGDRLVCYTDGVSETANARGEQFSDRRLMELLVFLQGDPETVVSGVIEDLSRFSFSGEPEDDCTLLVFIGAQPSEEGALHAT